MTKLAEGFLAQARSMREFGYPDVTAEMIKAHHASWLAHEPASDVVAMFSYSAFDDYPEIFGVRPSMARGED